MGTTTALREQMESEGWFFDKPCTAYASCTMRLHFEDPFGGKHAVADDAALERYFGTLSQRIEAMERQPAQPPQEEQGS